MYKVVTYYKGMTFVSELGSLAALLYEIRYWIRCGRATWMDISCGDTTVYLDLSRPGVVCLTDIPF